MSSTKHSSSQAMPPSPWRHHFLVRLLLPILFMYGLTAFYLNSKSNDNGQGRTGMDKLLNEPVLKQPFVEEPVVNNQPLVVKEPMQEEQKGVNFLLPTDPVAATPSAKSAKAEGDKSKSKGGKAKEKSKAAKAEGAKAEKHDGKSKGAKAKGDSKSKGAKAKAEGAKAEKQGGKADKGSAKAGKSKEKNKGGAKAEKKSAKATAEKIVLDVKNEMEEEEVQAEYSIEDAE